MDITYQYLKKRCDFGRQPMFCEAGPDICDNIEPNPVEQRLYILRNPVHRDAQYTPSFGKCRINTPGPEHVATGINHVEGGWPRDVNVNDPEAMQRHRRRGQRDDDNYIRCIMTLAPVMDKFILQNNTMDLYESYFSSLPGMHGVEHNNCRTVNVYRDMELPKRGRPISSICWQPGGGRRIAVTYVDVDADRNTVAPLAAYIWDINDANDPEAKIHPPCPLMDLRYNPHHENILAAALLNGQVGAWDARAGSEPVVMCPPHVAHRDLARKVLFIASKSGDEFFSAGTEGVCKWWDMRNMDEPTQEMIMDMVKNPHDTPTIALAHGASAIEYEPTMPALFMVGTEDGLVISGNRKGKTAMDKLPGKYAAHLGPVHAVERNPGSLKNFLTVGDWTARVWSDECRQSAVLWTPPSRHRLTHATWSPTRYSLMLVTRWDGVLMLWDLLQRQHEPAFTLHVCDEPLLRVRMHEEGQLAACGSQKGNIYLEEVSPNLRYCDRNDKAMLTAMFEREGKRERILETRVRELRLRRRVEGESSHRVRTIASQHGPSDSESGSEELDGGVAAELAEANASADYFANVKKEMIAAYGH